MIKPDLFIADTRRFRVIPAAVQHAEFDQEMGEPYMYLIPTNEADDRELELFYIRFGMIHEENQEVFTSRDKAFQKVLIYAKDKVSMAIHSLKMAKQTLKQLEAAQ
tara:strand:+ start:290 stop:607 length:318 start_codon:yes stop_codon:yes gene_type:complete